MAEAQVVEESKVGDGDNVRGMEAAEFCVGKRLFESVHGLVAEEPESLTAACGILDVSSDYGLTFIGDSNGFVVARNMAITDGVSRTLSKPLADDGELPAAAVHCRIDLGVAGQPLRLVVCPDPATPRLAISTATHVLTFSLRSILTQGSDAEPEMSSRCEPKSIAWVEDRLAVLLQSGEVLLAQAPASPEPYAVPDAGVTVACVGGGSYWPSAEGENPKWPCAAFGCSDGSVRMMGLTLGLAAPAPAGFQELSCLQPPAQREEGLPNRRPHFVFHVKDNIWLVAFHDPEPEDPDEEQNHEVYLLQWSDDGTETTWMLLGGAEEVEDADYAEFQSAGDPSAGGYEPCFFAAFLPGWDVLAVASRNDDTKKVSFFGIPHNITEDGQYDANQGLEQFKVLRRMMCSTVWWGGQGGW
jgi:hypothetical protein